MGKASQKRQLTEHTDVLTLKLLFKKWLHYFLRYKNELCCPLTWIAQYSEMERSVKEVQCWLLTHVITHTVSICWCSYKKQWNELSQCPREHVLIWIQHSWVNMMDKMRYDMPIWRGFPHIIRSTWAPEDCGGLALVCEMGVPHR